MRNCSYARGEADGASDLDQMAVEYDLPDKGGEYLRFKEDIGRVGVGVVSCYCPNRNLNVAAKCREPPPTGRNKEGKVL